MYVYSRIPKWPTAPLELLLPPSWSKKGAGNMAFTAGRMKCQVLLSIYFSKLDQLHGFPSWISKSKVPCRLGEKSSRRPGRGTAGNKTQNNIGPIYTYIYIYLFNMDLLATPEFETTWNFYI